MQEVAAAALDDETHVIENRKLYRAKFDLADQIVGDRYGYRRPAGGFFLWLDVSAQGGSVRAAEALVARGGFAGAAGRIRILHDSRRLQSGPQLYSRRDGT